MKHAMIKEPSIKGPNSIDHQLAKAIATHILNVTSIPEVAKYHHVFHITEQETGLGYFSNLELHTPLS